MPRRRRASHTSTSSEQSTRSENIENANLSDEFPDAGLPKTSKKGGKKKKNVSITLGKGKKKIYVDLTDVISIRAASTSSTGPNDFIFVAEQPAKKTDNKQHVSEEVDQPPVNAQTEGEKNDTNEKPKEPEVIKLKQIEEKDVKAAPNEVNKIYKNGVKSMNIEVHPALFTMWYMSELPTEANAFGISVLPAHNICDVQAVMFTQNVSSKLTKKDGEVWLSPNKKQCLRNVYVLTAAQVAAKIQTQTFCKDLEKIREMITGELTLVMLDHNKYFEHSPRCKNDGSEGTADQLDKSITELLAGLSMDTIIVHSASELAHIIVGYARALGEESLKKEELKIDAQADFYMRGDNKNCVAVDKDGNGLSRLWQQMLAILPMSSLEISRSLTSKYPTPRALANELCTSEGESRVSDVSVSRAATETARGRRLGPEFARKLHLLLTADDGNRVIE